MDEGGRDVSCYGYGSQTLPKRLWYDSGHSTKLHNTWVMTQKFVSKFSRLGLEEAREDSNRRGWETAKRQECTAAFYCFCWFWWTDFYSFLLSQQQRLTMCQYTIFCIVQPQLSQETQFLQEIFGGLCGRSLDEDSYTSLNRCDLGWRGN